MDLQNLIATVVGLLGIAAGIGAYVSKGVAQGRLMQKVETNEKEIDSLETRMTDVEKTNAASAVTLGKIEVKLESIGKDIAGLADLMREHIKQDQSA